MSVVNDSISSLNNNEDQLCAIIDTLDANSKAVHKVNYADLSFTRNYINKQGNLIPNNSFFASEKIYNVGKDVSCENLFAANKTSYHIGAYDLNDSFLSAKSVQETTSAAAGTPVYYSGIYSFSPEVAYIRVSYNANSGTSNKFDGYNYAYVSKFYNSDLSALSSIENSHYEQLVDTIQSGISSLWNGKKWVAYGTSVTKGEYGFYPAFLEQKSGLSCINKGIPGGTISNKSNESSIQSGNAEMLTCIVNDANNGELSDADLVTIEGVVNDWNYGRPIGEIDEQIPNDPLTDIPTTVCGGLRAAIKAILTNSNATVVLLTDNSGPQYPTTAKNGKDKMQKEYNDAMKAVAELMGVHCIDVAAKAQINEYHPEYIANSVHHTELGGKQYAATVWDELRQIHCNNDIA